MGDAQATVELGLGLIGIGREWGYLNPTVPGEKEALAVLRRAVDLGIRYFDTAPSYGISEHRLGLFLRSLTPPQRARLTIATKFGEHWDAEPGRPFVDHSLEALKRSLDVSLRRLGPIDVLQLHKTTPDVLKSEPLARAWEYAESLGIHRLGASVSDLESAEVAIRDSRYTMIQLPFSLGSQTFAQAVQEADARGLSVAVNRPFGMGRLLYDGTNASKTRLFRFILDQGFHGIILCGTKSEAHLEENWLAFREASGAGPAGSADRG